MGSISEAFHPGIIAQVGMIKSLRMLSPQHCVPMLHTFYNHIGNDHTLVTQYRIYQIQARPPEKYTNEQDLLYA